MYGDELDVECQHGGGALHVQQDDDQLDDVLSGGVALDDGLCDGVASDDGLWDGVALDDGQLGIPLEVAAFCDENDLRKEDDVVEDAHHALLVIFHMGPSFASVVDYCVQAHS